MGLKQDQLKQIVNLKSRYRNKIKQIENCFRLESTYCKLEGNVKKLKKMRRASYERAFSLHWTRHGEGWYSLR